MIDLNYRDSRPIYEQIKEKIRMLIVTGVMAPGEKLLSVRELASQLAINPNTIQRAYRELEAEGYIYSVQGKGSFAGKGTDIGTRRAEELLKQFDEAAAELGYLGYDTERLIERLKGKDGKSE